MSLDAMKQALEALEAGDWYIGQLELLVYTADDTDTHRDRAKVRAAITALRAAIEQAQEPFCYHDGRNIVGKEFADHSDVFPLYTAPRQWQGLTDEEISSLWDGHIVPVFGKNGINPIVFARVIEAKLREKNT